MSFSVCKGFALYHQFVRSYAVKVANPSIMALGKKGKKGAAGAAAAVNTKKQLEVEKDTHKLVSVVCGSNILIEGEDVKLKPDSEYPDWLWSVHTGPPKTLEDYASGTKEYWEELKRVNIKKAVRLRNLRRLKDY